MTISAASLLIALGVLLGMAAPSLAHAEVTPCKFYTKTIPLEHETCVKLVGTSFNMRDQAVRVHLDDETLVNLCVADVAKKFPGKSPDAYRATCEDIFKLTF